MDPAPSIASQFTSALRSIPDFPKKGIIFKDITPIFMQPELCSLIISELIHRISHIKFSAIAGIETRGYLFGFSLAQALKIPFIIIRKAGKLPGNCQKREYSLEYGKAAIEIQEGLVEKGTRVLIHDDLLATGGTAEAAGELIKSVGGEIAGFLFLIELKELKGKEKIGKVCEEIVSLVEF